MRASEMNFLGAYGSAPPPPKSAPAAAVVVVVPVGAAEKEDKKEEEKKETMRERTNETGERKEEKKESSNVLVAELDAEAVHRELELRLPAPTAQVEDQETWKKVAAAVAAKQTLVTRLKNHTAFKNPEIMAQLVKVCKLHFFFSFPFSKTASFSRL